jgi:hypothetical protein
MYTELRSSEWFKAHEQRAIELGLFKHTWAEAQNGGACVICGEDHAKNTTTVAGKREFEMSGVCEKCYDNLFKGRLMALFGKGERR